MASAEGGRVAFLASTATVARSAHLPTASSSTATTGPETAAFEIGGLAYAAPFVPPTPSKRPVASRSRSYRLVSGNGGNQDSRRTIQSS